MDIGIVKSTVKYNSWYNMIQIYYTNGIHIHNKLFINNDVNIKDIGDSITIHDHFLDFKNCHTQHRI